MTRAPNLAALAGGLARGGEAEVLVDAPLRDHGWYRIGGPADLLVTPRTLAGAGRIFAMLADEDVPVLVIGDGSNLLFDDAGFRGVVVRIGRPLSRIRREGRRLLVEAGAWSPFVARAAARAGLTGIEHIVGIPGTFGGLVAMNGGSLRKSVGERIVEVGWLDAGGSHAVSAEDCGFAYRTSRFQRGYGAIGWTVLELDEGDRGAIRREMLRIITARRRKFPLKLPNCGSVFLSSPTLYETIGPPGRAIEEAGLRGLAIGGAQISPLHGNFIVNTGGASSRDVLALIARARGAVEARTGVAMDCEVKYVAPTGRVVPAHIVAGESTAQAGMAA
ncbi:MAG: UDP-N-acetylmuramate dehydrogenase [Pseudomonadota bacterium]